MFDRILTAIGLILVFVGGAALDGPDMTKGFVMAIIGGLILLIEGKRYEKF